MLECTINENDHINICTQICPTKCLQTYSRINRLIAYHFKNTCTVHNKHNCCLYLLTALLRILIEPCVLKSCKAVQNEIFNT